jgi:hypothetical protein
MDDSGRAHEEDMFSIIRSPQNLEEHDEQVDDGSQYLNDSGEGVEEEQMFQNAEQLTNSGEVYILGLS